MFGMGRNEGRTTIERNEAPRFPHSGYEVLTAGLRRDQSDSPNTWSLRLPFPHNDPNLEPGWTKALRTERNSAGSQIEMYLYIYI